VDVVALVGDAVGVAVGAVVGDVVERPEVDEVDVALLGELVDAGPAADLVRGLAAVETVRAVVAVAVAAAAGRAAAAPRVELVVAGPSVDEVDCLLARIVPRDGTAELVVALLAEDRVGDPVVVLGVLVVAAAQVGGDGRDRPGRALHRVRLLLRAARPAARAASGSRRSVSPSSR